jgi:hypothetical protein
MPNNVLAPKRVMCFTLETIAGTQGVPSMKKSLLFGLLAAVGVAAQVRTETIPFRHREFDE